VSSQALGIDRLQQSAFERFVSERDERAQKLRKRGLAGSLLAHLLALLVLWIGPSPGDLDLPPVVSIDLVAAPRASVAPAPSRAAARPAPPKPAPPAPAPKPSAAPPPPPKAKTKVLPQEAPQASAKPVPQKPRERPKELEYDDALAALREEAGEPAPSAEAESEAALDDAGPASESGPSGSGRLDPEHAAWQIAVNRHIRKSWVVPTEYRGSGLRTLLAITILGDGTVIGQPTVRRSSGDPRYDDNAVRAVSQASPLPPPPSSGDKAIWFSEE